MKGIKALYDKLFPSKTATTTTTTKTPTTTTTTKPVLPVGYTQNKAAIPYHIDPKLKNAGAQGVYQPPKNVGVPQQLKKWMNQQWKNISMAGQKLNQTMGTMWKNFVNKMNTNPLAKKL